MEPYLACTSRVPVAVDAIHASNAALRGVPAGRAVAVPLGVKGDQSADNDIWWKHEAAGACMLGLTARPALLTTGSLAHASCCI